MGEDPVQPIDDGSGEDILKEFERQKAIADSLNTGDEMSRKLWGAANKGEIKVVKKLIEDGCDPNGGNSDTTPLIRAALKGHSHVVRALLSADGIEVDRSSDTNNSTPLSLAAQNGRVVVVKDLLEGGASPNRPAGDYSSSPLMLAAMNKHLEVVTEMLKHKDTDVNFRDPEGKTALFEASMSGAVSVMKKLIEADAQLNQPDERGMVPLHIASEKGHEEAVKLLLKSGAEIDYQSNSGLTALHYAASANKPKVVKILIAASSALQIKASESPLELAERMEQKSVIKILKKATEAKLEEWEKDQRAEWEERTGNQSDSLHLSKVALDLADMQIEEINEKYNKSLRACALQYLKDAYNHCEWEGSKVHSTPQGLKNLDWSPPSPIPPAHGAQNPNETPTCEVVGPLHSQELLNEAKWDTASHSLPCLSFHVRCTDPQSLGTLPDHPLAVDSLGPSLITTNTAGGQGARICPTFVLKAILLPSNDADEEFGGMAQVCFEGLERVDHLNILPIVHTWTGDSGPMREHIIRDQPQLVNDSPVFSENDALSPNCPMALCLDLKAKSIRATMQKSSSGRIPVRQSLKTALQFLRATLALKRNNMLITDHSLDSLDLTETGRLLVGPPHVEYCDEFEGDIRAQDLESIHTTARLLQLILTGQGSFDHQKGPPQFQRISAEDLDLSDAGGHEETYTKASQTVLERLTGGMGGDLESAQRLLQWAVFGSPFCSDSPVDPNASAWRKTRQQELASKIIDRDWGRSLDILLELEYQIEMAE